LRTAIKTFGIVRALMPVLYCGGLAIFFFRVGGSVENVSTIGLGPTVLGLGIVGFLFCIPAIVKLMRFIPGPRPPRSGDGPDEPEGFDPDAAIARYMARQSAETIPVRPAASPAPKSAGPAKPSGFGRRGR
jgi:hypothetical protein